MQPRVIAIPRVDVVAEEAVRVVVLPDTLSKSEVNAVMACLISTLKTTPADYLDAVELVYNIMQMALAGLRTQSADIRSVNITTIHPTKEEVLKWVGLEENGPSVSHRSLPVLPGPVIDEAKAMTAAVPIYAAVASILFAMGRQASEKQSAAALDKRPDALIRRFTVSEEDRILLPGQTAGPSRESLEYIYNAFSVYTELRAEVVRFLIGAQRGSHHYPRTWEVVMTNFHLMRGSGMTHVDAILKLAQMHPWTLKIPELEPYWDRFKKDLQAFHEVEEDVRPYHRLLVPQTSFLFLSPGLTPLIAVAGHLIKEVETTFANYVYRASEHADLIDLIDRYKPGYVPTHQTNTLAMMLGVADEPLPKLREAAEPTAGGVI